MIAVLVEVLVGAGIVFLGMRLVKQYRMIAKKLSQVEDSCQSILRKLNR